MPPNGSSATQRRCPHAPKEAPGHLWCPATPGSVEQGVETEQGQHHRGGDKGLCLERAETIFSSGVVVRNTGWLVLCVSIARLSSGPGWKDAVPGGGTRASAPSVGWALSLAWGCIPLLCDLRVLSVRSLLVTVSSTCKTPFCFSGSSLNIGA